MKKAALAMAAALLLLFAPPAFASGAEKGAAILAPRQVTENVEPVRYTLQQEGDTIRIRFPSGDDGYIFEAGYDTGMIRMTESSDCRTLTFSMQKTGCRQVKIRAVPQGQLCCPQFIVTLNLFKGEKMAVVDEYFVPSYARSRENKSIIWLFFLELF